MFVFLIIYRLTKRVEQLLTTGGVEGELRHLHPAIPSHHIATISAQTGTGVRKKRRKRRSSIDISEQSQGEEENYDDVSEQFKRRVDKYMTFLRKKDDLRKVTMIRRGAFVIRSNEILNYGGGAGAGCYVPSSPKSEHETKVASKISVSACDT